MKYFTVRGASKNSPSNGKDRKETFIGINGAAHSSAQNLSKLDLQDPIALSSTLSHYYYAQPRQKQRPQLAQQFNLKLCKLNRRSIVGNANDGIVHGHNGVEHDFAVPKSAPLPRKCYQRQETNYGNDYNESTKQQNRFYEHNHFDYEDFAISHNGTLPSKVRKKELHNGIDTNEGSFKVFSPFQKLLNRQKIRGTPINTSQENLYSPEENENNANHKLFHYHNHNNNNDDTKHNANPEYGELREIVRRIEMQEQNNKETQYIKQVKHHPVLLVQQKLHHAMVSPHMQNGVGSDSKYDVGYDGPVNGKNGVKLLLPNNGRRKLIFDYLPHSVIQR